MQQLSVLESRNIKNHRDAHHDGGRRLVHILRGAAIRGAASQELVLETDEGG